MLYSYYLLAIVYIILKGAEVNLYTLKYKPVYRGIQICFHTLYYRVFEKEGHTESGSKLIIF